MKDLMLWIIVLGISMGIIWIIRLVILKPTNIKHFYERLMLKFALGSPEILSMIRVLEKFGIHFHNKQLNNESDSFRKKQMEMVKREFKILKSYDRWRIVPKNRISYDIMEWYLQDIIDGEKYMYHDYPINQMFGVQNQLPSFMASTHQVKNVRDAKYYNIRLSKFIEKFQQVIEGLKIREEKEIIPPTFVIEKVIAEMKGFISSSAADNFLYKNMSEKLLKIETIKEEEREILLADTKKQIQGNVYPAYQMLIDYLENILEQASRDAGVWKLPDGKNYYQYLLRHYTTTNLTAEQIHKIGLQEVSRIQGEMKEILESLGYKGKSVVLIMNELSKDPRFSYNDDPESPVQVLKDYQTIIDRIEQDIDDIFDIKPKAKVIVDRIPEFKEKTAPGAYYNLPAMDGSRPGIFSVNLSKLPNKYDMETLAIHEAIPGHHFQLAIQQELKGLPTFRKLIPFTAYAEGWALYTEKLAYEFGLFSDKYSQLGYLSSEIFRAVRLVVDTGLHHKRWTREEAIEYMVDNTGVDNESIVIEVERYIVMPGQATAYKIGELEILKLRKMAQDRLGKKFDIKRFHDVVLKSGSVPLEILGNIISKMCNSNK